MITTWSLTSLGKITYCYRSMLHRVISVVCPIRRVCIYPLTLLWWGVAAFSYLVLVIVHRQQIVLVMSPDWLVLRMSFPVDPGNQASS
jgi:hypothetical protein